MILAPYLVASHTPGMSAVQFQWQQGRHCEMAFGVLHELRAGVVRPGRERIDAAAVGPLRRSLDGARALAAISALAFTGGGQARGE